MHILFVIFLTIWLASLAILAMTKHNNKHTFNHKDLRMPFYMTMIGFIGSVLSGIGWIIT